MITPHYSWSATLVKLGIYGIPLLQNNKLPFRVFSHRFNWIFPHQTLFRWLLLFLLLVSLIHPVQLEALLLCLKTDPHVILWKLDIFHCLKYSWLKQGIRIIFPFCAFVSSAFSRSSSDTLIFHYEAVQISYSWCDDSDLFTRTFISIMDCFHFTQYVSGPTHSKGQILDLVFTLGFRVAFVLRKFLLHPFFLSSLSLCLRLPFAM